MTDNSFFVCTTFSKNYLPYVRNFTKSYLKHHPGSKVFALLVDQLDGSFDPSKEDFELFYLQDLGIKNLESFVFKYCVNDLNTAVKPGLLRFLYNKYPEIKKLCYFDPDIVFFKPIQKIIDLLGENNFVLTPHITSPIPEDGLRPTEVNLLQAGSYNLGFIGTSRSEETIRMLDWWDDRLYTKAVNMVDKGLYTDQKWMDLLIALFEKAYVLREPGYNVAYWNLHERSDITEKNGEYFVNGKPLYFFHFSGFPLDSVEDVSKHQTRHKMSRFNDVLKGLFMDYKKDVLSRDYYEVSKWPYYYGAFKNHVKISDYFRTLYWGRSDLQKKYPNPFESDGDSFLNWLISPARDGSVVTNLMEYFYNIRSDLQKSFPDIWGEDQFRFLYWAKDGFANEYKFDRFFIDDLESKISLISGVPRSDFVVSKPWNKQRFFALILKVLRKILGDSGYKLLWRVYSKFVNRRIKKAEIKRSKLFLKKHFNKLKKDKHLKDGKFGVNIIGYIDAESGVGEGARGIIRAVEAAGVPFSLCNLYQEWVRTKDHTYTDFTNELPYNLNIIVANADMIPVVVRDVGEDKFNSKYNVGFWAWELEEFPSKWIESFNYVDEVWTMSTFCLDSISRVSPVPVLNLPIPIEFETDNKFNREYFGLDERKFMFLFCFDGLSFIERKNPFACAEAFAKAFKGNSNAFLVIKCHNVKQDQLDRLKSILTGCDYKIVSDYFERDAVLGLLNCTDCYVSLHRAEGFGYMMGEAMYLGKHVIATGYSGNVDFMNVNNSNLVKFKMVELKEDVGPYEAGNSWAEPDIEDAAQKMKSVFSGDRNDAAKEGSKFMKKHYSKVAMAKKFGDRIKLICNKINT